MRYNFDDKDENPFEAIVSIILIRFVILALMLIFMVPKVVVKKEDEKSSEKINGMMTVECVWETGKDYDIDLWIKAPNDELIGYTNQHGEIFDLVRDDIGKNMNPTGLHYEIAYAKSTPAGKYTINVHFYRNGEAGHPNVKVDCNITMAKNEKADKKQLYTRQVELNDEVAETREQTIVSFELDEKHDIVDGSISKVFEKIAAPNNNYQ